MTSLRILFTCSWAFFLARASAQVQEATLVASSPFRMAISPTASRLTQGTLQLIRATAATELKEAQSKSDLPYLLDKTKIVLQEATLQAGENLTIIRFFALTTQTIVSVPPGTAFREVRLRDSENRQKALNELVEAAMGNIRFTERLQQNANLAFGDGDERVTADTMSQISAIESIAVAPVATAASGVSDSPSEKSPTDETKLSSVDVILIVVIILIFIAIVCIIRQFRRDSKDSDEAVQTTVPTYTDQGPMSPDLGTVPVIDEEAAFSTSSDDESSEAETTKSETKEAAVEDNFDESSSSVSSSDTSESGKSSTSSEPSSKSEHEAGSTSTPSLSSERSIHSKHETSSISTPSLSSERSSKSAHEASSISTPSLCSSRSAASRASTGAKSRNSTESAKDAIKASLYSASTAGLQAVSLSQSGSAAFTDDDVSDVVAELLKTTLCGTISGHEILAETKPHTSALPRPPGSISTGDEVDENLTSAESLAESFTSDFFGSKDSSSNEGKSRGKTSRHPNSGSSSSYYSSSGSSSSTNSSEDPFNVDVEAASKKSGSQESKQSSAASVSEWMKTIQVVSGSATTDSKTTASSQERSSVSSLTAPSMAASVGVSTLELSLSRLDLQAKKSTIKEEECVEV